MRRKRPWQGGWKSVPADAKKAVLLVGEGCVLVAPRLHMALDDVIPEMGRISNVRARVIDDAAKVVIFTTKARDMVRPGPAPEPAKG